MTEQTVSDIFRLRGRLWVLRGGKEIAPSKDDVSKVLDKAREMLYTGGEGDLVIIRDILTHKTETGYDVYVLAGSIE